MGVMSINGSVVHLEKVVIDDEYVSRYLQPYSDNQEQLEEALWRALKLGVFALTDDKTGEAIKALEDDLKNEFADLVKRLNIAREVGDIEVPMAPTVRGVSFEEVVAEVLHEVAANFGDTVTMTGNEEGILKGNKIGDVVIEVNTKATLGIKKKIVIEAKSHKSLSQPAARKELEDAKANREASKAILAFDAGACPGWIAGIAFYEIPPEGIAVTVSDDERLPLILAYRIARYELIGELAEGDKKLDLTRARTLIARAKNALKQITTLKSTLTSGINKLQEARNGLDPITAEFDEAFKELDGIFAEE